MKTDQQLLEEYIKQNSQTAFREIVNRNGRMVFSTCNRILNDSHLAEDATQDVFLQLIKKASSIKSNVMIGGWLHNSAVWAAHKVNRSRTRTLNRERNAAMETELSTSGNEESVWGEISPHLDDAISPYTFPAQPQHLHRQAYLMGFAVLGPLARCRCLLCHFCSLARRFDSRFLQTQPRDYALALL